MIICPRMVVVICARMVVVICLCLQNKVDTRTNDYTNYRWQLVHHLVQAFLYMPSDKRVIFIYYFL